MLIGCKDGMSWKKVSEIMSKYIKKIIYIYLFLGIVGNLE
jgi:hypothetical protein